MPNILSHKRAWHLSFQLVGSAVLFLSSTGKNLGSANAWFADLLGGAVVGVFRRPSRTADGPLNVRFSITSSVARLECLHTNVHAQASFRPPAPPSVYSDVEIAFFFLSVAFLHNFDRWVLSPTFSTRLLRRTSECHWHWSRPRHGHSSHSSHFPCWTTALIGARGPGNLLAANSLQWLRVPGWE